MKQLVSLQRAQTIGEAFKFADRDVPNEDGCMLGGFTAQLLADITYGKLDRPRLLVTTETGQLRLVGREDDWGDGCAFR